MEHGNLDEGGDWDMAQSAAALQPENDAGLAIYEARLSHGSGFPSFRPE